MLASSRWHPLLGHHLHDFVGRHRRPWDIAMSVLSVAYIALGVMDNASRLNLTGLAVWTLSLVFFLEFLLRFLDDPTPRRYVRDHWIDLVTCIPSVGPLRLLRLLRLLRVFNTAGLIKSLARDRGDASSSAGLRILVGSVFVFWLFAGCAFYVTELNQPHSTVHSFQDALFLAFTTSTSVGYSPLKAVTYEGQIVAGIVVFLGLGLLTAASSRLTSLWMEGSEDREVKDMLVDLRDQLGRSETRLAAIEKAVTPASAAQSLTGLQMDPQVAGSN